MAYTIISQNNTTTTLQDENGNIIYVPGRVTLATSTDYTITEVNNNTATLTDGSGKVIRDVPCVVVLAGGGSSDTHNKGYYATPEALAEAEPTAEAGDWAIVGSTDTVWVWDEDSSAWVDTDTKGEVTPDMIIVKSATMPTASTTPGGAVYQYIGATDSTYTHGYIYENKVTTSYDSTVSFEAATLSSSIIACSGSDFATFVAEWGSGDITTITHGTLTYDQSGGLLVFVGKDSEETTVCTFQLYTQDYEDAGFTITGTLQDGDVIAFTCSVEEASASYAWNRIDVQPTPVIPDPLPSQTGNAGKFLTTDGTAASWSDKPLVNTSTATNSLTILGNATSGTTYTNRINIGVGSVAKYYDCMAIGANAKAEGDYSIAIGRDAKNISGSAYHCIALGNYSSASSRRCMAFGTYAVSSADYAIAIGCGSASAKAARATAIGSIQLGASNTDNGAVNSDANTFKVANANGNFEIMSADGTIPTARLTKVNTTVTLAAADWSAGTQTVTVNGITATSVVWVSPDPSDQADYVAGGILCTAQAANSLTFTASTTPTNDIDVVVVAM